MSQRLPADVDPCAEEARQGRSMPLAAARARMLDAVTAVDGDESVPLAESLDRVLSEDVYSGVDVPSHTNSAMDGFAVAASDLPAEGERAFPVAGTAWAGRPYTGTVTPGDCVRIMTGAAMPPGLDTVIMQEHVRMDGETAVIASGHRPGQHVRQAGEDVGAGDLAVAAGTLISAAHVGLLASLGIPAVRVRRRPRVAFFSTGDELRPIGQKLGLGQIYDSNRYTLGAMIRRLNIEPLDMGVVGDDREALETAFEQAAAEADAVITTGGVSVGAADFVTGTLERLGSVGFWKVAMKPGKPVAFGRIGSALFFGLPGNPVSVMATFYQLVQPALERLRGIERPPPPVLVRAVCSEPLRKRPGRTEFQRGVLEDAGDGRYTVRGVGHQGAGVLRSMAEANCFIVLAADQGPVEAGSEVTVQPFPGLI
ncbi:MAG: molybdopterin molybdotransferase MoeA [Gammaproteobacteria bacterium]